MISHVQFTVRDFCDILMKFGNQPTCFGPKTDPLEATSHMMTHFERSFVILNNFIKQIFYLFKSEALELKN